MTRPSKKKSDVIAAALALFMKQGIKATTTREIAQRAGVSEGTIYRHFENKKKLAEFIFEENLEIFWNFLRNYLKETQNADEMIQAFVEGIFEFSRNEQRRYNFIMAAHQTELKRHSREKMKPKNMLMKIIRHGQQRGLFRKSNAELSSAMIIGTIVQTIFYMRNGKISVKYNTIIEEVSQACLKIIR